MKLSEHILQIKGYVPLGGNVPDGYLDQWIEQARQLEVKHERLQEIIQNATVESAEEFVILSLTHEEYEAF